MEPTILIKTAAEGALIAICATTAGLILLDPAIRAQQGRLIAAPFVVFAIARLAQLADSFGLYAERPSVAAVAYGVVAQIPGAVFLAVRRLAGRELGWRAAIHVVPAVAAAYSLGALFAIEGLAAPGAMMAKRVFWWLFCPLALGYLAASVWMLRQGFRRLRDRFAFRGAPAERRLDFAVLLLVLPLGALAAEVLAAAATQPLGDGARLALGLFRMACIAALAVLALQPRSFFGPDQPEAADPRDPPEADSPGGRYARSRLDPVTAERTAARIEDAIRAHSLHRDPFLTRDALAAHVGAPPHRVSQVFNQTIGLSFYDYVNARRIDEARSLLDAQPERPVAEIAAAVGFNSRSAFHGPFRKHTGLTPTAWRRRSITHWPPATLPEVDPA